MLYSKSSVTLICYRIAVLFGILPFLIFATPPFKSSQLDTAFQGAEQQLDRLFPFHPNIIIRSVFDEVFPNGPGIDNTNKPLNFNLNTQINLKNLNLQNINLNQQQNKINLFPPGTGGPKQSALVSILSKNLPDSHSAKSDYIIVDTATATDESNAHVTPESGKYLRNVEDLLKLENKNDQSMKRHRVLHVLYLAGKGEILDPWLKLVPDVCRHYHIVVIEDELLIVAFRERTTQKKSNSNVTGQFQQNQNHNDNSNFPCKLIPFDSNQVSANEKFHSLPWRPDEILPIELQGIPLVSLHAYKVFEPEAKHNPHKWLESPDLWVPYFLELNRQGFIAMCLEADHCLNDRLPFRLIFTEEIGSEVVDCLSNGVIPIFYMSAHIAAYLERTLLFMPFFFTGPEEMFELVSRLTDGPGILTGGVKMYMTHESNHYLTSLYWGQNGIVRLLSAITSMYNQEVSQVIKESTNSISKSDSNLNTNSHSYEYIRGELLICVHSTPSNRKARDLIRNTWAQQSPLYPGILIRVIFFLGWSQELEHENLNEQHHDMILLRNYNDKFEHIWLKTAAILRFGAREFQKNVPKGNAMIRYLMKVDDDTFLNVDAVIEDLFSSYSGKKPIRSPMENGNPSADGKSGKSSSESDSGNDLSHLTEIDRKTQLNAYTNYQPDSNGLGIQIQGTQGTQQQSSNSGWESGSSFTVHDVEIGHYETSKHLHSGHYWGHIMALVQPNRNTTDRYFVPYRSFGNEFYPAYSRGIGYALSEDLVLAVGQSLIDGQNQPGGHSQVLLQQDENITNIDSKLQPLSISYKSSMGNGIRPFPYREDVSVGLYLYEVSRMGLARVRPMQRKDHIPLNAKDWCQEEWSRKSGGREGIFQMNQLGADSKESQGSGRSQNQQQQQQSVDNVMHSIAPDTRIDSDGLSEEQKRIMAQENPHLGEWRQMDLLELHRYGLENHDCLWKMVEKRRKERLLELRSLTSESSSSDGTSKLDIKFQPKKEYISRDMSFCQCLVSDKEENSS